MQNLPRLVLQAIPMQQTIQSLWVEEFKGSIKSFTELKKSLGDFEIPNAGSDFSIFVSPLILKKLRKLGPTSKLWKQFVPSEEEDNIPLQQTGLLDPIADSPHQVSSQLIHRYSSRALFLPTSVCPVHCRYCFRRNVLGSDSIFDPDFSKTLEYLKTHPQIHEIIFTGGDPLSLSDSKLEYYLTAFSEIPSIKYIRFHTRFLTTIPARIDKNFLETVLPFKKRFREIIFALHINHTEEICPDAEEAIGVLTANFKVLSQTVLLRSVNDSVDELAILMQEFNRLGIVPYYLHQTDSVKGGMHFVVSPVEGLKIYAGLRRVIPGWMLPHFVTDPSDGSGKIPVALFESQKVNFQEASF